MKQITANLNTSRSKRPNNLMQKSFVLEKQNDIYNVLLYNGPCLILVTLSKNNIPITVYADNKSIFTIKTTYQSDLSQFISRKFKNTKINCVYYNDASLLKYFNYEKKEFYNECFLKQLAKIKIKKTLDQETQTPITYEEAKKLANLTYKEYCKIYK